MMQDWDRLAMILVGFLVSLYTGWAGWKFWRKRNLLAVAGVIFLILSAIGLPVILVLFAT